jgi:drug/metabolite transporter (DMT)-like permease
MTTSPEHKLAYAAWIAVCLIWGTTYLAIKIGLETIPPALMGGLRFATAGVVLAFLLRVWDIPLPPRASWPGNVVIAFFLLGLGNGFVMWGEQWVPSGLTAVLLATTPFWMVGIEACLSSDERVTLRHVLGLLLGFAGILLLVWPDLTVGGTGFSVGFVSLQIACVGWSLGSAYSRRHARADHALAAAAVQMFAGGMMMIVAGTLLGDWPRLVFTPRTL